MRRCERMQQQARGGGDAQLRPGARAGRGRARVALAASALLGDAPRRAAAQPAAQHALALREQRPPSGDAAQIGLGTDADTRRSLVAALAASLHHNTSTIGCASSLKPATSELGIGQVGGGLCGQLRGEGQLRASRTHPRAAANRAARGWRDEHATERSLAAEACGQSRLKHVLQGRWIFARCVGTWTGERPERAAARDRETTCEVRDRGALAVRWIMRWSDGYWLGQFDA